MLPSVTQWSICFLIEIDLGLLARATGQLRGDCPLQKGQLFFRKSLNQRESAMLPLG